MRAVAVYPERRDTPDWLLYREGQIDSPTCLISSYDLERMIRQYAVQRPADFAKIAADIADAKSQCCDCGGTGLVEVDDVRGDRPCKRCKGTGKTRREKSAVAAT